MSDVRRVMMTLPNHEAPGTWYEAENGFHALTTWKEHQKKQRAGRLLVEMLHKGFIDGKFTVGDIRKIEEAAKEFV